MSTPSCLFRVKVFSLLKLHSHENWQTYTFYLARSFVLFFSFLQILRNFHTLSLFFPMMNLCENDVAYIFVNKKLWELSLMFFDWLWVWHQLFTKHQHKIYFWILARRLTVGRNLMNYAKNSKSIGVQKPHNHSCKNWNLAKEFLLEPRSIFLCFLQNCLMLDASLYVDVQCLKLSQPNFRQNFQIHFSLDLL